MSSSGNASETGPLRLGIAGLGTVGGGVVRMVQQHGDLLATRCSRPMQITAISARDKSRDRGLDLGAFTWHDDPVDLARSDEIDVLVELIGGNEGPAKLAVEAAIANGKDVVTANKALIAHHGTALARTAEAQGVALNYEAAVAGGIPIVKAMREGLAGNSFSRVYGILNGTCNYILSAMRDSGRDFSDVLDEAQALGYAEADPAFDVDGVDAAHKLAILTSLAFGCPVNLDAVHIEGIRQVSAVDIEFATELGYRIKLLAIARLTAHGVEQRVHPCMVAEGTSIAHVDGVFNAVVAEGDFIDRVLFEGRGAGEGPTASAVLGDLVDIGRNIRLPAFSVPAEALQALQPAPMDSHVGPYYVRLSVLDRPGVIADISAILRDEHISIGSMLQHGRDPGEAVTVVLITHENEEAAMGRAMALIGGLEAVLEEPKIIRIEAL
ncbi:MAG: homoserine dehydrogenase [Alphaproteobacteria bacterium]|nr:homoserine dehydrogenase [Rhodospirillaceae bacterium]MDP6023691.1 homoserine dehydrogenase [Alphaproteobacteria bacterium]MDP6256849.1 homoserine dehydrogenase [Alphaproteobacteria bacterium]MDP7227086.1 homoserine dehydrogenase [Alphaproteobacteria bacterium]MDP7461747.1 homoserine dehydrogenase [Alphaproteobacteria bacterium]|tara:strand:- start:1482 stop:2798 length:1317 start_codon:yes stop_codon:yes gene_type:complete